MRRLTWLVVALVVAGAAAGGYLYLQRRTTAPQYRLAKVQRGPLTAAVSATGTLNAVVTVLVGSQVSGQIKELLVDFNSIVRRGQVIARIDPDIFDARVSQARAELESAQANVLNQQAQVERARADVENARAARAEAHAQTARAQVAVADAARDLERKAELFRRELIAQSDRDSSQAAYDSAVAQLEAARAKEQAAQAGIGSAEAQLRVAQAALASAGAQVNQRQAQLQAAMVDLAHTTIRAPVDGVVVSRAVDVGQTVAASLQAPTLFTIAQDLTRMQVETSVDEADIGRIRVEGPATFTVDAFAGQTFTGRIAQVRKAPQIVQNVVTYTVVVEVANPERKLLPGMTANVKLVVAERQDALRVPNAALRFRPPGAEPAEATPAGRPAAGAAGGAAGQGGAPPSAEAIRERLVKGLGLSAEQQARLDPILEDSRQQSMALRGLDLPEPERQARRQKIREAARVRIRELLTAEQRARYDEMTGGSPAGAPAAATPGRVWVVGPDGAPRALPLTLGLSDGTFTEVLRGDLKEGQEVIVGLLGAAPAGVTPGGAGPRLRL